MRVRGRRRVDELRADEGPGFLDFLLGDGDGGAQGLGEEGDAEFFEEPAIVGEGGVGDSLGFVAGEAVAVLALEGVEDVEGGLVTGKAGVEEFLQALGEGFEVTRVVVEVGPGGLGEEAGVDEGREMRAHVFDGVEQQGGKVAGEFLGEGVVGGEDVGGEGGDFAGGGVEFFPGGGAAGGEDLLGADVGGVLEDGAVGDGGDEVVF